MLPRTTPRARFNMRDPAAGLLRNDVTSNRYVWMAVLGCALLLGAAAYLPGLDALLQVKPLSATEWSLIAAGAAAPVLLGQLVLLAQHRHGGGRADEPSAAKKNHAL